MVTQLSEKDILNRISVKQLFGDESEVKYVKVTIPLDSDDDKDYEVYRLCKFKHHNSFRITKKKLGKDSYKSANGYYEDKYATNDKSISWNVKFIPKDDRFTFSATTTVSEFNNDMSILERTVFTTGVVDLTGYVANDKSKLYAHIFLPKSNSAPVIKLSFDNGYAPKFNFSNDGCIYNSSNEKVSLTTKEIKTINNNVMIDNMSLDTSFDLFEKAIPKETIMYDEEGNVIYYMCDDTGIEYVSSVNNDTTSEKVYMNTDNDNILISDIVISNKADHYHKFDNILGVGNESVVEGDRIIMSHTDLVSGKIYIKEYDKSTMTIIKNDIQNIDDKIEFAEGYRFERHDDGTLSIYKGKELLALINRTDIIFYRDSKPTIVTSHNTDGSTSTKIIPINYTCATYYLFGQITSYSSPEYKVQFNYDSDRVPYISKIQSPVYNKNDKIYIRDQFGIPRLFKTK